MFLLDSFEPINLILLPISIVSIIASFWSEDRNAIIAEFEIIEKEKDIYL